MSSPEELKKARTYTKARFTKIKNSLIQGIGDNLPQRTIDTRYKMFTEVWTEVQERHEAYTIFSDETENDDWMDSVLTDFEEVQSAVEKYSGETNEKKPAVVRTSSTEIQRKQEDIRFKGICQQLKDLLSANEDEARYSAEVIREFTMKLEASKKRLDKLYDECIEVVDSKDIEETTYDAISDTEKQFNKLYGDAKIFISKFAQSKQYVKDQRSKESSGIRLEKIKFSSFNGDIRKYPCFRKEFKAHIKPHFTDEEEAFVLKSYLHPEIREEVATLGEDAEEIWERLDGKYGDEGKLVDSIMADVKGIPLCTDDDPKNIMLMITTIERAFRDLKYMSMEQEISNSTIVSFIEQRLPKSIEDDWLKIVTGKDRLAVGRDKFPVLFNLMLKHKAIIEYKSSDMRNADNQQGRTYLAEAGNEKKPWCWLHPTQNDHPIWRCRVFLNKGLEERINLVKTNKSCLACLEQGHTRRRCQKGFKCRENNCGKPHHSLIHVEDEAAFSLHGLGVDSRTYKEKNTLLLLQNISAKCSGQRSGKVAVNCLWDSGSTLSFISFDMARRLNLKGSKVNLKVTKIGGVTEEIVSSRYDVSLVNEQDKVTTVTLLGLEKISTKIQTARVDKIVKQFPGVSQEDIRRPMSGDVDMLLGLDVAGLHPVRIAAVNHLLLLENEFGLVIGGTHPLIAEHTRKVVQYAETYLSVTEFQDLEQLGVCCKPRCGACRCGKCHPGGMNMTLQEEDEYKMILSGLTYDAEEAKWTAEYPWKKDPSNLPDNYVAALGALKSLERGLKRDSEYAELYKSQMQDMLDRKVCRRLTKEEMDAYKGPFHYIAHHGVLKPESKSTKLRIVFNSSANFKGHVLNDYYVKGPSMLNDLLGLLLRFSEEEYAVIGDISKMYHAIKTPIKDQMTHRFLWRNLMEDKKPQTYVMTVVNFGDRPSGGIAVAVLRETAKMSKEKFPVASRIVEDNSYMDDILYSVESKEEAERIRDSITNILARGGFKIKNWVMTGGSQSRSISLAAEDESERVLGMLWDPSSDKLYFKVKLNFSTKKGKINTQPNLTCDNIRDSIPAELSKRAILSQINSIYDPRGLLAPFTVRAKIMMRKLWAHEKRLGWDDPIPHELREDWVKFFVELFEIENLQFERCLKPKDAVGNPMLVIFSDGSAEAFAAVAYARWEMKNGCAESRIITSKNKIAPVKIENIVRLELCGAILSKRLRVFIEDEMGYEFSRVVHLVDSEIVKAMIEKKSYGFRTFVANRIGEIQSSTASNEWYWIPGTLNVADWVTRGKHPQELKEGSIWRSGPEFLQLPFTEWPIHADSAIEELPERIHTVHTADVKEKETLASRIDISRFSNLQILLNTTARVLRLYRIYRKGSLELSDSKELTSADIKKAEDLWVKEAQTELICSMKAGKLVRLTPRMKGDVIVVGGRTKKRVAPTWNNEEFILLPSSHRFSLLVVWHMHEKGCHLGVAATTAMVRSKYWIISLPRIAKNVCFSCVICRVKRKYLAGQIMADLPIDRLQPSPPFYVTGVDFFGPFCLKGEVNKRSRGKGYGVIFVCYSSRAVHCDVSVNYSTDAFLQTLRRFVSIRGWPKKFRSDSGSQLVAASKELRMVINDLDHERIRQSTLLGGSEWVFSAADAPWTNGATEALVKSVKRALHTIIGDQVLMFSELQTVMYEAAELVNERPIGRIPSQPDDGSYLCPNDLILGRASTRVPQGPFKDRCSNKYRLDFIERLVQNFWSRWSRDLFPNLVIQTKWHVDKRNVEKDDVVLIQDSNSLRGQYKMGIVTAVFPSEDGKVRRVEVSYKNNKEGAQYEAVKYTKIIRPVHKLVVIIPVGEQRDES